MATNDLQASDTEVVSLKEAEPSTEIKPANIEEANSPSATGEISLSDTQIPAPTPTGSLIIRVNDESGKPISRLEVRISNKSVRPEVLLFEGKTSHEGELPPIEGIAVGTRFEVSVKRDSGSYKFAAIGSILASSQHCGNLCIPRTRFEFTTFGHHGIPGQHQTRRKELASRQPSESLKTPNPSLNKPRQPTVQEGRDGDGRPVSLVKYGLPNMWGRVTAGPTRQPRLASAEKVKSLIDFAMEQVTWNHPRTLTSAAIIQQMQKGVYVPEKRVGDGNPGRGYSQSRGLCTKYVKIALWRSGFIESQGDFAPHVSLARDLGPALEKMGFTNVLEQIPDARWAAPGDIIVYQRLADPAAAGHVDIRSYDGYISDFFENYLPVTGFKVTGIYRKYHDPAPEARTRALLKIIRSLEAETVFLNKGDPASYKALPLSAKMGWTFEDFSTHPLINGKAPSTASGAYGINLATWRRYVDASVNPKPWVPLNEGVPMFSPVVQDRIAVAIMELHPGVGYARNGGVTALGLLRAGDFEGAAKLLATTKPYQWPSLPGGSQSKYQIGQMRNDFEKYLEEFNR